MCKKDGWSVCQQADRRIASEPVLALIKMGGRLGTGYALFACCSSKAVWCTESHL